ELYAAVYLLSEVKEDPASTPAQIAAAERALEKLTHDAPAPSEATVLARLYWWTVEYGLVGSLDDYRLYGAGLLSSLGEGHFCHESSVAKLPLTAACVEMSYDITRPQPQLYVARDFEQLERVLEDVEATLSYRRGGVAALAAAQASGEAATLELGNDLQLAGRVEEVRQDWLELSGPCAVAYRHAVLPGWPRPERYVLPLGAAELPHAGALHLALPSGLDVRGRVRDAALREGRVCAVWLDACEIRAGEQLLLRADAYPLVLAERVVTASADLPAGFHAETEFPDKRVPKPRQFSAAQRELIGLYEQTRDTLRAGFGGAALAELERIYVQLEARYPDEWLLRWNLLEALLRIGQRAQLRETIQRQLEEMEIRFGHREPIATGLAYLRERGL
ncbi:MAG TPA: hypothetical protein VJR89_39235, partial [Polyangiales bacterium]|nr:hypothetical protein [Polyangiales bacterium]